MPQPIPVAYSVPSSHYLRTWVQKNYALPAPVRCVLFRNGVNMTYRVWSGAKLYFLRVYRPGWRSARQIDFEQAQLEYLHGAGIGVSYPLRSVSRDLKLPIMLPDGLTYAALFTAAPGNKPEGKPEDIGAVAGTLLARLHAAQAGYKGRTTLPALDQGGLIDLPLRKLGKFRKNFIKDWMALVKISKKMKRELGRLPRTEPFYGLIHGDTHTDNMHFDIPGNIQTLFDFDMSTRGWRLFDLATFMWGYPADDKVRRVVLKSLLASYSRVSKLSKMEIETLPTMMAVRSLWWLGFYAELSNLQTGQVNGIEDQLNFIKRWDAGEVKKSLFSGQKLT